MDTMPELEGSVDHWKGEVDKFLSPLLHGSPDNTSQSLVEKLAVANSGIVDTKGAVDQACQLLRTLHEALVDEHASKSEAERKYDISLITCIYGLLDFIILEGVYPSLTPGLVSLVERRAQSILFDKTTLHVPFPKDVGLITEVVYETLDDIALDSHGGLQPVVRGRILNDLITAHVDLAYSPNRSPQSCREGLQHLRKLLDGLPMALIYQGLTSAMKPNTPDWFRAGLSECLSRLPIRPYGVRHLIEFIANSHPASSVAVSAENGAQAINGSPIPIEALTQASKILSAVPRGMEPQEYLAAIGPQLLDLLDGSAGMEGTRFAGHIIASGILGKRTLGAPGTVGWQTFVEPIQKAINPPESAKSRSSKSALTHRGMEMTKPLVSDEDLLLALKRLLSVLQSHSNVGLTGRLLRPLVLPLWGIATYDAAKTYNKVASNLAGNLLKIFFQVTGNLEQYRQIANNLLWRGPLTWTLGSSDAGGVAIFPPGVDDIGEPNVVERLKQIDRRIDLFSDLLRSASCDDNMIGTLFIELLTYWLKHRGDIDQHVIEDKSNSDPFQNLAVARLVQKLLEGFRDSITKDSTSTLRLIEYLINDYLRSSNAGRLQQETRAKANYEALTSIVQNMSTDNTDMQMSLESEDVLGIALSLLITLLSDDEVVTHGYNRTILEDILQYLIKLPARSQDDRPHSQATEAAIIILQAALNPSKKSSASTSREADVKDSAAMFATIQQDLGSNMPPIRTSAIQALGKLVRRTELHLDVTASTILLLHVIRTEQEEYVYLAAIKVFVELAVHRDLRLTTRYIIDAFQDTKEETGLDGRLRIGETVVGLIDVIDEWHDADRADVALVGNVVRDIAQAVLKVAGRRGSRMRETEDRQRTKRQEQRSKREAERSFGGEPSAHDAATEDEHDDEFAGETSEQRARRLTELAAIGAIVKGWEETGIEEDVRIRTSALTIVGRVLRNSVVNLTTGLITEAVDLALAVLVIEGGATKAIARRAGVLIILDYLKAMDDAQEAGAELAAGLDAKGWMNVEKVLRFSSEMDGDDTVRGHAAAVLESLEAWKMKRLFAVKSETERTALNLSMRMDGHLKGLSVRPGTVSAVGRTNIEEIE